MLSPEKKEVKPLMAVLWIWEIWVGPEGRMGGGTVENAVHGN